MSRVHPPGVCDTCGNRCYGKRCQPCRRASWACAHCGADTGRSHRKFCSRECQSASSDAEAHRVTCEWCGSVFRPKRRGVKGEQRFCSVDCRYAEFRRKSASKPPKPPTSRIYVGACRRCGGDFASRSARARYCSDECRRVRNIERIKGLYRLATQFDPKTGQYPGAEWRKQLLAYLVERDGDECAICGRNVDLTLKSGTQGSRQGPSIDHLVPRSQGGTDDLSNLRLAHWGCNQQRGNRGGGEQLVLVG